MIFSMTSSRVGELGLDIASKVSKNEGLEGIRAQMLEDLGLNLKLFSMCSL